jgi:lysine 2,3-aminomutase
MQVHIPQANVPMANLSVLVEGDEDEPPGSVSAAPYPPPAFQALDPSRQILPFPSHRNHASNLKTRFFRRKFYAGIPSKTWNDWHWQVSRRVQSPGQIERMLQLSEEERSALAQGGGRLPVGITPYYMSLLNAQDPASPLRRTVIPTIFESLQGPGEAADPLGEEGQSPVPGLVHRYPDRVLLLVHDFCSTYCRYCTRSRVVGHDALHPSRSRLERALAYIRDTPDVRDVLISGGDPLVLGDDRIEWILKRLRQIPHIEIIRIGTKVPAVLPQRITPSLVRMLRRYHPIWMSIHFTHPEECTQEAYRACAMLANAGIPLGSQTVLLKGINDNAETMKTLVHQLMQMRVRPYYLYQCDPIIGSSHFRTSVEKGLEIIRALRGFTSGYAVPTYVVDAPGGGGKIPLAPDNRLGREKGSILLKNYEGGVYRYPDGVCASGTS